MNKDRHGFAVVAFVFVVNLTPCVANYQRIDRFQVKGLALTSGISSSLMEYLYGWSNRGDI
jgi:hypothetical protein